MDDILQARGRGHGQAGLKPHLPPPPLLLFLLVLLVVLLLAVAGSHVKEQGLPVLPALLPVGLAPGLRLGLVVQQQVRGVVALAVGHHHCADGAGVDVLDLEEALDHVDVFRLDILLEGRRRRGGERKS